MTLISDIIPHLRVNAPIFQNRVGGASEYAALETAGLLATPSAYVLPGEQKATENESQNGLYQLQTEFFHVIVMLSNATGVAGNDRRGQATVENYYDLTKYQVFQALLNWNPNNRAENPQLTSVDKATIGHGIRGFYYVSGSLREFDTARLYYEYVFGIESYLTNETDGWNLDGVPLDIIDVMITDGSPGEHEPPDTFAEIRIINNEDLTLNLKGVSAGTRSGGL